MTVTFVDDLTDAECDESEFVADASSNLATAIEMLAYAANAESDVDADSAEELELCLDPDCIGTVNYIWIARRRKTTKLHRDFGWKHSFLEFMPQALHMEIKPFNIFFSSLNWTYPQKTTFFNRIRTNCNWKIQKKSINLMRKRLTVLIAIGCEGWYD